MRIGALRELKERCLRESGNDQTKANRLLKETFAKELRKGPKEGIDPKGISYLALFEGLVNLEGIDKHDFRAVSEAVSSSAFTDITTLVTHAIVIEPYDLRMEVLGALVTESNATMTLDEEVRGMTALGGLRRRLETQSYEETDFEEKRVTVKKMDFGRSIALTFEDLYNDRTGDISSSAMRIGDDATQHREQMIIETLEVLPRTALGEATSRAFVLNGTAHAQANFYNATHAAIVGLDGQINKNTATGGIAEAGFKAAYDNFAAMKDEKGKFINPRPKNVVVHQGNELVLATLLGTERNIGTAYNDINQFGPRGRVTLAPITSPYLATTSGLFYMGDPARSMLWLWVQKPNTQVLGASTEAAVKRKIVWEAVFNYYGGVAHRDYRYIVRGTTS